MDERKGFARRTFSGPYLRVRLNGSVVTASEPEHLPRIRSPVATRIIHVRTTQHPGYAVSQEKRKCIEEPFGWGKTIGGLARPMLCGAKKARVQIHSDYGQLQSHPNTKAHCGRGLRSPGRQGVGALLIRSSQHARTFFPQGVQCLINASFSSLLDEYGQAEQK